MNRIRVEHGRGGRARGCRAREPKKRSQLAEVFTGADRCDDLFASVGALTHDLDLPLLDEVFSARLESNDADEQRYFGEFFLEPAAKVDDLAAAYGIEVPASAMGQTLAGFVLSYLERPVVGDRLRLGGLELTVRRMEHEHIVELGLRLPHEAH